MSQNFFLRNRKNFYNWRLKVFIHFETFEKKTFVQLSFDIHFDTSTWSFGKTILILNSISWPIDFNNPKGLILKMKNIVLNMIYVLGLFHNWFWSFQKFQVVVFDICLINMFALHLYHMCLNIINSMTLLYDTFCKTYLLKAHREIWLPFFSTFKARTPGAKVLNTDYGRPERK